MKTVKCGYCGDVLKETDAYWYDDKYYCEEECILYQLELDDIVYKVQLDEEGEEF